MNDLGAARERSGECRHMLMILLKEMVNNGD